MNWKLILRICCLIDHLELQGLIDCSEEEAEDFLSFMYISLTTKTEIHDLEVILNATWKVIGWENKPSKEIIEIVKNFGLEDE